MLRVAVPVGHELEMGCIDHKLKRGRLTETRGVRTRACQSMSSPLASRARESVGQLPPSQAQNEESREE